MKCYCLKTALGELFQMFSMIVCSNLGDAMLNAVWAYVALTTNHGTEKSL